MSQKKKKMPKMRWFLTLMMAISGISLMAPATTHAAGWVSYAKNLTLGETVNGSMKEGDYVGRFDMSSSQYYWHIYRFTMPDQGRLNMYLESAQSGYLSRVYYTIFSASDPDNYIWDIYSGNVINSSYSSARERYYGSTGASLEKGEYYFAVRAYDRYNTPYYLTLSYQKPVVNITSISLNPSSISLEVGDQQAINADILPTNATNSSLVWESSDPSVATVQNGVVQAVSVGYASITASSSDGEISSSCAVTIACRHNYQGTVIPAGKNANGYITRKCLKCGDENTETIYAIGSVGLSRKTYVYSGGAHHPAVIIRNTVGNDLRRGIDYTVSYPQDVQSVGKHTVTINFKGNYRGSAEKSFTIVPKATSISKIIPKKRGFAIKWKKQASQTSGYEVSYSYWSNFAKSFTHTMTAGKNRTSFKSKAKLQSKRTYYVKIRTYKTVRVNGVTKKIYSKWSGTRTVVTR